MKSRITILVLLLTLLVSLVPFASAQNTMCYGISDADCQILTDAEANSANVHAFNMTFSMDFKLDAAALAAMDPTMTESNVAVTAKGTGAVAYDATAADPMKSLALKMDLQINVTEPASSVQAMDLSFVISDGVFYMLDPTSGQWIGMELESLLAQAGIPLDLSTLSNPAALGGSLGDMGMGDFDASTFITQERLADDSIMGQTVYPFTTSIDLIAMLTSPDFQTLMQTAMASAGGTDAGGDQTAMVMGMLPMLPMLLQDSTAKIDVTEWIGADDMFVHKVALKIDGNIDLNSLMAMGGQTDAPQLDPIVLLLDFWVEMSDINGAVDITVPEGAVMTPGM